MSVEFQASETVSPARRVVGRVRVPGDKSISHRYAILAALAGGVSEIHGYAPGADCASTLTCLAQLGVEVTCLDPASTSRLGPTIRIIGRGLSGLQPPNAPLDAGNSGTALRMLAGVVAAHPFETTLTGDQSLRRRPMTRIVRPLRQMGAEVEAVDGRPPLTVRGGTLSPIDYTPDVPSAQVKTAILLAGLQTRGRTIVREVATTRDHTERALRTFGAHVDVDGLVVTLEGEQSLRGTPVAVPGDVSSAVFWAVAGAALPGSAVEIVEVGLNPSRTAVFHVLERMGVRVVLTPGNRRETPDAVDEEPVGSVQVAHGTLRPVEIAPAEVPGLIDELPALAALATFGGGLRVTGAAELRTKESDRIAALVSGLRALGADAEELPDGFEVRGSRPLAGGVADACDDHRLAMAFAIAALGARAAVVVQGADAANVSYPGFFATLASLCR
ncbi:MAG: 3-phosphoshikimate 1-carboxyvinyltransferase [Luteitalea sp.]|nr:3-phosphoshikimate 1-carboxyvinyltransferase [Luteitalea sp.]